MNYPPLKQYFESRLQLIDAVNNTPKTVVEYEVKKYCTISVNANEEESTISLKPKQVVIVEWQHPTPTQQLLSKISISDPRITEESNPIEVDLSWSADKLTRWLMRYAKPGINIAHKK